MARSPQQVGVIRLDEVSGGNTAVVSPRACLPGHSVILGHGLNSMAWDPWLVRLLRNQPGPVKKQRGDGTPAGPRYQAGRIMT